MHHLTLSYIYFSTLSFTPFHRPVRLGWPFLTAFVGVALDLGTGVIGAENTATPFLIIEFSLSIQHGVASNLEIYLFAAEEDSILYLALRALHARFFYTKSCQSGFLCFRILSSLFATAEYLA